MGVRQMRKLCSGLALFLFGMSTLSQALEELAGSRLRRLLCHLTAAPLSGLLLGAGVTIALQSSSALTVILVGLVSAGALELSQTVSILMGANIGTTLIPWLLCLSNSGAPGILELVTPILALCGAIILLAAPEKKAAGALMCGFGVLFTGMELMQQAAAPLTAMPGFQALLLRFHRPLPALLAGAAFTGILQSSAASVGILQTLARSGAVTYGMAIPLILGQNIGTCVTALLSSLGLDAGARRVAVLHMSFNVIGSAVLLPAVWGLNAQFGLPFWDKAVTPAAIAGIHTLFNLATAGLLLPWSGHLVALAEHLVPSPKARTI